MKRKKICLTRILCAVTALSCLCTEAFAYAKQEIVYLNLDAAGALKQCYVVNRFEGLEAGEKVTDWGDYDQTKNLTDLSPLTAEAGGVGFTPSGETFYYQGRLKNPRVPWKFSFEYRLDGESVSPEQLGGKSGRIVLDMGIRKDPGAEAVFSDNYTLQMTVTLDTQKCANILAPGATAANAGKNRVLTYTALAGSDAEKRWSLAFDATDFSMDAITLNGIPLHVDVGSVDTGGMKDKVKELQDAVDELDEGAAKLNRAAKKLSGGADSLTEGSAQVKSSLKELSAGAKELSGYSAKMLGVLDALLKELNASSGDPSELVKGYGAVAEELGKVSANLDELISGSAAFKKNLDALSEGADHASDIKLLSEAVAAVKGSSYAGKFKKYTDAAERVLKALAAEDQAIRALDQSYAGIDSGVRKLKDLNAGMAALAKNLNALNAALKSYVEKSQSGLDGIKSAVTEMRTQYALIDAGLDEMQTSLAKLSERYGDLDEGVAALDAGAAKLKSGVKKLDKGTGEMADEAGNMEGTIDEEVDKAVSKYKKDDFAPVSFVDPRNSVSLAQFVIKTEAIEAPEAPEDAQAEAESAGGGIWDRFLKLFGK